MHVTASNIADRSMALSSNLLWQSVPVRDRGLIQMGDSGEANEGSVYRAVMRVKKTKTVLSRHHSRA